MERGETNAELIEGIIDRVVQQVIAQILIPIFDNNFSEYSWIFRVNRSQHMAINQTLGYLNEEYNYGFTFEEIGKIS